MADLNTIAKNASTAVELIAGIFPWFGSLLGPAAPAAVPLVEAGLNAADGGLKAIADSKPGATPEEIFQEFISHITPGQPNSPALT